METKEQNTTTQSAPASNGAPRGGGARGARGRGGARSGGRRPSRDSFGDRPKPEFEQKTLSVRRVTRVVAGGRRFAFSVVLAIGDKKGSVGVGIGKAGDTALAIEKAYANAKKHMLKLKLNESQSIPFDVQSKYNSARVFVTPNGGRGVVAGSSMRILIELGGIHDVTGRVLSRTKNKLNIARATMKALARFAHAK